MDRCSMYWGGEKCKQTAVGKPEEKIPFGRLR
jgi:hypothetical protein